jgi:hypothetical protein
MSVAVIKDRIGTGGFSNFLYQSRCLLIRLYLIFKVAILNTTNKTDTNQKRVTIFAS